MFRKCRTLFSFINECDIFVFVHTFHWCTGFQVLVKWNNVQKMQNIIFVQTNAIFLFSKACSPVRSLRIAQIATTKNILSQIPVALKGNTTFTFDHVLVTLRWRDLKPLKCGEEILLILGNTGRSWVRRVLKTCQVCDVLRSWRKEVWFSRCRTIFVEAWTRGRSKGWGEWRHDRKAPSSVRGQLFLFLDASRYSLEVYARIYNSVWKAPSSVLGSAVSVPERHTMAWWFTHG